VRMRVHSPEEARPSAAQAKLLALAAVSSWELHLCLKVAVGAAVVWESPPTMRAGSLRVTRRVRVRAPQRPAPVQPLRCVTGAWPQARRRAPLQGVCRVFFLGRLRRGNGVLRGPSRGSWPSGRGPSIPLISSRLYRSVHKKGSGATHCTCNRAIRRRHFTVPMPLSCILPPAPPLVSLIVLTCNRPGFLKLSLASAAMQSYPHIEAIVIDDGSLPVQRADLKTPGVGVKLVRLEKRSSIGEKRNAGVRAARGAIIMHWDDDDVRDPLHVSTLACPILRNMTDIAALTFSFVAKLSTHAMKFYDFSQAGVTSQATRMATGPFLGSLAYSRAVAVALGQRGPLPLLSSSLPPPLHVAKGTWRPFLEPFADASLSEDLDFVERALRDCLRMLPIAGLPMVYTRHDSSLKNTWRPTDFRARMQGVTTAPPEFMHAGLIAAYVAAEAEASQQDDSSCSAPLRREPGSLKRPLQFPYMPKRCCKGGRWEHVRRPCTDAVTARQRRICAGETFCGSSKGVCTSTCMCTGGSQNDATPGVRVCGAMCCNYWHRFWRAHPENCTTPGTRPLKRQYCTKAI
jgi:hypothetical protein